MAIALHYAIRSDVGLVRSTNQDSGYAGPQLMVVADGMGGHAGGDVASSLAIAEMAQLDSESYGSDEALPVLAESIRRAHQRLIEHATENPALADMGTTITAILRAGDRLALAHIGDSRAYVLRDGSFTQITKDHTFVQTLVDEGRLTPEEAEQHPQRSVIMRVLSPQIADAEPDMSMREARVGDRYLLCSDGLSGVVSHETLYEVLASQAHPDELCETLIQLALRGGAPDNVTCIVADIVEESTGPDNTPLVAGSAASQPNTPPIESMGSSAERAAELTLTMQAVTDDPNFQDTVTPTFAKAQKSRSWTTLLTVSVVASMVVGVGLYAGYGWTQTRFYMGTSEETVALYRGVPQDVGPLKLSSVDQVIDDVLVSDLDEQSRQLLSEGILLDTREDSQELIETLRRQAFCNNQRDAAQQVQEPTEADPTADADIDADGATTDGVDGGTNDAASTTNPDDVAGETDTEAGTETDAGAATDVADGSEPGTDDAGSATEAAETPAPAIDPVCEP